MKQKDDGVRTIRQWAAYGSARPELTDRLLQCVGVGEVEGYYPAFRERTLTTHGLVLISSGHGLIWPHGASRAVRVVAPAIIWVRPGQVHSYGPSREGWREHWMLFAGSSSSVFDLLLPTTPGALALPVAAEALDTRALFEPLAELVRNGTFASALEAAVMSQRILTTVIAAADAPPADSAYASLIGHLRATAHEPLSIPERARRAGVSVPFLRQAVHDATGLSPSAFLTQVRISEAQTLLVESTRAVAEVARAVGYDDPAYFSRQFSLVVGVPPQQFRAQERRAAAPLA